jgi:hypothetical protein
VSESGGNPPLSPWNIAPRVIGEVWRRGIWRRVKDFSGGGDATYLWPRWIVLRAVGLVYILIFAGITDEGQVLVGPRGLIPLGDFFTQLHRAFPLAIEAFIRAPSLFWAGTSAGMITVLAWGGLLAAVAVVLNLWSRMALFACWLIFLSFVAAWGVFSGSQVDQLMLETALLCIPFAPAGFRPGLGASSPPRPIAVFVMRWLLFRIMFESGLVKLITGDPHWRNFTAMDVMYETSPFPTILGYLDHQMSHGYHVFEIALTFAAEMVAPVLAVFGGRRGRWWAFGLWLAFQAGIQLTNNFGWLNTASIALGILLLDDQMLIAAAEKLGLRRVGDFLAARVTKQAAPAIARWRLYSLRAALWTHFSLTFYFFGILFGLSADGLIGSVARPVVFLTEGFHSANPYTLYAGLLPARYGIEFDGSNDGGETWRTYDYWYQPQRLDRICPFIAPWYPRFEATLQIEATRSDPSPLYRLVAAHLLQRDPAVMGLFRKDPFPDRPPVIIRIPAYRLTFTDAAIRRSTGNFWHKEPVGEYETMMFLNQQGQVVATTSALDEVRMMAEMGNAQAQDQLGFMYANGEGVAKDNTEAVKWLRLAAEQGVAEAQSVLGLMYAAGAGVPRDEIEGLAWFDLAARAGEPQAMKNRELAEREVGRTGALAAQLRSQAIAAEIEARKKSN